MHAPNTILVATCMLIVFVRAFFQYVNLLQLCVPGCCPAAAKVYSQCLLRSCFLLLQCRGRSMSNRPCRCHAGVCPCPNNVVAVCACLLEVSLCLHLGWCAGLVAHQKSLVPSCAPTAATSFGPSRSSGPFSLRQGGSVICLKDFEDSERNRLVSVWAGFAESLLPYSEMESAGVTPKQLGHLFQ